jgi:hypothetical protein
VYVANGRLIRRRPLFDLRYSEEEVRESLSNPDLLPWALKDDFFREAIADTAARETAERVLRYESRTSLISTHLPVIGCCRAA